MALGGIGDASAILGVAQIGLQLSQTLVTVIGDYRDAATNINRLRDEIHLTSIALQQLGDLAQKKLLRDYGILEATNLRDRTQAEIWKIRTTIRKSDHPLHPIEITKEDIDVTCFQSLKWALWTKKQLEEPRQELDRLKDSMTLTFVSHMALLASDEAEKRRYASQIPGIKRSIAWSNPDAFDEDRFKQRLEQAGLSPEQIAVVMGENTEAPLFVVNPPEPNLTPNQPRPPDPSTSEPLKEPDTLEEHTILKAWSLDPLAHVKEVPLSNSWLEKFLKEDGDAKVWDVFEQLHPWFKNEITAIFNKLGEDQNRKWNAVMIKPVYKHRWIRRMPQSVQLVMKGEAKPIPMMTIQPIPTMRYKIDTTETVPQPEVVEPTTYSYSEPIIISDDPLPNVEDSTLETDEQIIERQLALYQ